MSFIDFKRCQVVINKRFGNPEKDRLQTIGIDKAFPTVQVSDVVGMTLDVATTTLRALTLGVRPYGDSMGLVISQSPIEGEFMTPHSVVSIFF